MSYSLSAEFTVIYNILKAKQFENANCNHTFYGCSPYSSNILSGYWMNKLLPSDVKEYNKWFGDNIHNCQNGVLILLPTFTSFKKFYRNFTRQELINIILNPDNYVFVSNGKHITISGINCQWDAEVLSLNNYIHYLVERGLQL